MVCMYIVHVLLYNNVCVHDILCGRGSLLVAAVCLEAMNVAIGSNSYSCDCVVVSCKSPRLMVYVNVAV